MMRVDPEYVQQRSLWVIIRDFEQEACFVLMLWALAIMTYKGRSARPGSSRLLREELVPLSEGTKILPEDVREYSRQLQSLPAPTRRTLLPRALLAALQRFGATQNIQDVSTTAHGVCEAESERLESELSMVRYIAWAIPSIGFIGTVRGIGDALGKAHQAVEGNISGVTQQPRNGLQLHLHRAVDQHRADVPALPAPAAAGATGAGHRDLSRRAPDPAHACAVARGGDP